MDLQEPSTPETQPPLQQQLAPPPSGADAAGLAPPTASFVKRIFVGPQGLRAGWSVLIFIAVWLPIVSIQLIPATHLHAPPGQQYALGNMLAIDVLSFLSVLVAAWVVTKIEHRSLLDFYLRGPNRVKYFVSGLAAGFVALSALVGLLAAGGWLHFGGVALSGSAIVPYALLWGLCFLLVGLSEEGLYRCYLQFTLTRGINFWWAFGIIALICAEQVLLNKSDAAWGVYAMALLGLVPCYLLHRKSAARSAYWQAAWLASTLFGYGHTANPGETTIGILQTEMIAMVFCVSIKLTGSAWWAIGCHAAWDWAQTYFYGTPDSGMTGEGHLLNSTLSGNALWSGAAAGPEGSALVIAIMLLLLAWILIRYGKAHKTAA